MENFRLKKDQFGPRSIDEVRADMRKAKFKNNINDQVNSKVNIPKDPLDVRSKIDTMNNLRKRTWK